MISASLSLSGVIAVTLSGSRCASAGCFCATTVVGGKLTGPFVNSSAPKAAHATHKLLRNSACLLPLLQGSCGRSLGEMRIPKGPGRGGVFEFWLIVCIND